MNRFLEGKGTILAWCSCFAILFSLATCTSVTPELQREREDLFTKARESFEAALASKESPEEARKKFVQAGDLYKALIQQGIQSGYIYYNTGNAYHSGRQIGKAILYYRLAEYLMPRNRDLLRNIDKALSARKEVTVTERSAFSQVFQTIAFWHFSVGVTTRFYLLIACLICVLSILTIRLFYPRVWNFVLAVLFGIVGILFMISVTVSWMESQNTIGVITQTDGITARQGAGENYPNAFSDSLSEGTEFVVVGKHDSWIQIELLNESRAWIPATSAEIGKVPGFEF